MIQAVIFDMDGILIDTEKYLYRYWKQASQEAGYELTHEQLLRFRSFSKEYAEPYFKELLGQDFDFRAVRALIPRNESLVPDRAKQRPAIGKIC